MTPQHPYSAEIDTRDREPGELERLRLIACEDLWAAGARWFTFNTYGDTLYIGGSDDGRAALRR